MTLDEGDSQEDQEVGEEESDADQGDGDADAEPVDDNDAREPEFLAGVSMDPSDKRPPPCFAFAKDGKCPFVNCKYSHNADDIRVYQEMLKNKSVVENILKNNIYKAKSVTSTFAKPSSGAKGTSPGVKPSYTSILRGVGTVTRKST